MLNQAIQNGILSEQNPNHNPSFDSKPIPIENRNIAITTNGFLSDGLYCICLWRTNSQGKETTYTKGSTVILDNSLLSKYSHSAVFSTIQSSIELVVTAIDP